MSDEKHKHYAKLSDSHILECGKYQPQAHDDSLKSKGKPQNLNEGLLFESNKKYSVGDLLRLKLAIPLISADDDTLTVPITLIVSVVGVKIVREGIYEVAVCFTKLDQRYRSRLLEFLAGRK